MIDKTQATIGRLSPDEIDSLKVKCYKKWIEHRRDHVGYYTGPIAVAIDHLHAQGHLTAPVVTEGWKPIETAPMDGRRFDVWAVRADDKRQKRIANVYWHKKAKCIMGGSHPSWKLTHWQNIAAAPQPPKGCE